MDKHDKMPAGGWIGIGAGLGVAFGVALDNIGVGIAIGTALGVVMMALQSNRSDGGADDDSGGPT